MEARDLSRMQRKQQKDPKNHDQKPRSGSSKNMEKWVR